MKRKDIPQARRNMVKRLALYCEYKKPVIVSIDIHAEASKLMNSYYRLCALCERNLYLSNDETTCNLKSTKESEEREERWFNRLKDQFNKKAGLTLVYTGYYPRIGIKDDKGVFKEIIESYFYE